MPMFHTIELDLAAPAMIGDPYPTYDALRQTAPVTYDPKGFWFLSCYEHVATALRDPRLSNRPAPFALLHARHRARFIASDVAAHLVAFQDAPDHADLRRPLALAFGKRLRLIEADLPAIAAKVVADLPSGTSFDAVAHWAAPTALRTTARMIGLPDADLPQIARWSSDFFYMFHAIPDADTMARLNTSVADFRAYVRALLDAPGHTGLIADLGADLAKDQHVPMVDNIMLLIADGIENVRAGLASTLDILLRHRVDPAALIADPATLDRAIEEALRLESPGQYQGRITLAPMEIGGQHVRARSIVLLGYGAANRDPAAFVAPDQFDMHRSGPRSMTFGMGPHACLGLALVRVQMRSALAAMLARPVTLVDPHGRRNWVPRAGHRWLETLQVNIAP